MVVQRLSDSFADRAFSWVHEALLSWAPWKPHVDSELFDIQFEGDWPQEELTGLPSPDDPEGDADRFIPEIQGYALAVYHHAGRASVVDFGQLRSSWTKMICGGNDFVIMPVAPKAADWIICYFHHGYLELGRRVGDWPHKVSVDI
jgi:hypothetical protein